MSPMVGHASISSIAIRAVLALATIFALATVVALSGCGTSTRSSSLAREGASTSASATCPTTVLHVLRAVAMRVYHEGVLSERTAAAAHLIGGSLPLRRAVERNDPGGARAAGLALLATGHMTNLKVVRAGKVLANVGSPTALAPFGGTLLGAGHAPIATFMASVWSEEGFMLETDGITQGSVSLRTGTRGIAGSIGLPAAGLPAEGTLSRGGVDYQYVSFPVTLFPSGSSQVYLLRPIPSLASLCGHTSEETVVNTLSRIASLIYAGEAGRRALVEVARTQHDRALLSAVARRDPAATRAAVRALLNQHIVRLRVSAGGKLLADVGGPFVLAPVDATLRLGGRTIGSFVLSIQDDEGYKRLAGRLAGLDVLMYMGSRLVKNSLGPNPGRVPASGLYTYRGRKFRVVTIHATAFPSGPLSIRVLIPIPYS